MTRLTRLPLVALVAGLAVTAPAGPATADMLHFDPHRNPDVGYTPIQERSYEVIVGETRGYQTELRLRVALYNSSSRKQDAVLTLALPLGATLRGLRVARDGVWVDGQISKMALDDSGRREPGAVFVRPLTPEADGDLPGAELIAFSLEPATTTQVEVVLAAVPQLRSDRWELELPGRGDRRFGLADERRVIVKDPLARGKAPVFWVDGRGNDGKKFMTSNPEDSALIAWPARSASPQQLDRLDVHYSALTNPDGVGGQFRLFMRLGPTAPLRPDHVVVLIDRSRSTDTSMHRQAFSLVSAMLDHLPEQTTFDAIAFARSPTPLMPRPMAKGRNQGRRASKWPSVRSARARTLVANNLDGLKREQGTDIAAALSLAAERMRSRDARRPLIVVLTDGMLPPGRSPGVVKAIYESALASVKQKPELLFLVDEPMLAHSGITPSHPISLLAASLGARIRLDRFGKDNPDITALLSSPRVVHDLEVRPGKRASLSRELPGGLVAGHVIVSEGTYKGRTPPAATVRAREGRRTITVNARPKVEGKSPAALAAALPGSSLTKAVTDGFVRPPWLTRRDRRLAQLTITWAGRGGRLVRGYLDRRIFRNYLGTRVYPRARNCYNVALGRNDLFGGRVTVEVEVAKGEVMLARIAQSELSQPDPMFEACVEEAAWSLEIPAGNHDDRIYRVRYPLLFSPPRGGRPRVQDDAVDLGTIELLLGRGNPASSRP